MAASPPRPIPTPLSRTARVLVATPDPGLRAQVSGALRNEGHLVTEAVDGVQGVEHLDAAARLHAIDLPHLLVADVRMPGLGGFDLLRVMRAANLDLPVVLLTTELDAFLDERARRLGAATVVGHPVDVDTLVTTVASFLRPRRAPRLRRTGGAPRAVSLARG